MDRVCNSPSSIVTARYPKELRICQVLHADPRSCDRTGAKGVQSAKENQRGESHSDRHSHFALGDEAKESDEG